MAGTCCNYTVEEDDGKEDERTEEMALAAATQGEAEQGATVPNARASPAQPSVPRKRKANAARAGACQPCAVVGTDGNQDFCRQCLQPGLLASCDECPDAWCSVCLDADFPNDDSTNVWRCPPCAGH